MLRRGPSDWVRLSQWNIADDTFAHGQWMHARVYERRSDLSPDGTLFVAFVRGTPDEPLPNHDTWVAISRPPWFTALALWFVGGTYSIGGNFPASGQLWLGFEPNPPDQGVLPPWLKAETNREGYIDRTSDWPDRTVWNSRMLRDGWRRVPEVEPETWQRRHPDQPLTLKMILRSTLDFDAFGGRYQLDYELHNESENVSPIGRATWADWDQRDRLIVAREGKLFNWNLNGEPTVIADFNPQTPEPEGAPDEAMRWPSPGSA